MKKSIFALFLTLLLFCTTWGFDEKRKGFIIGTGAGLGINILRASVEFPQPPLPDYSAQKTKALIAPTLDFKIGFAPSDQWEIFYSLKSMFRVEQVSSIQILNTAAVNYYFSPQTPSFLIGGGIGRVTFQSFKKGSTPLNGISFYIGSGYEFKKHQTLLFELIYAVHTDSEGSFKESLKSLTPKVTLIVTAF